MKISIFIHSFKFKIGLLYSLNVFSKKIIYTKTRYKIFNQEILTILTIIKAWNYCLRGYKYEFFVLNSNNNFCHFIKIKSLSIKQVQYIKNYFDTIFQLIIFKKMLILLLISCCIFYSKIWQKKYFNLKTLKLFMIFKFY